MALAAIKKIPTCTVMESRLRIFQPTQRPVRKTVTLDGPWGKAQITGRLGQRHADLLEIIRASALAWREEADRVVVLVDPYEVRKKMGGSGQYSHEQMYTLLKDLAEAVIVLETDSMKAIGHLVDKTVEAKKAVHDPLTGKDRFLMKVVLGDVGLALLDKDLFLYYNPEPISALGSGMAQAVARHVLTHKSEPNGGWKVDTLIHAVAGDIGGTALRDARRRIKADSAALASCGVALDGDRVHLGGKSVAHPPDNGA